jgi:cephalosporin hydroxylase
MFAKLSSFFNATVRVRTLCAVELLTLLALGLVFLLGGLDWLVKHRIQHLSQREETEWRNQWYGVPILQYPTDLMLYQELIERIKPDVIIETGSDWGGNALYLASVLQNVNPQGKIVTVDIDARHWKQSMEKLSIVGKDQLLQRILFLEGDSSSPEIVKQAAQYIPANGRVLVILDSLHTREHVLKELLAYADLVSPDSYLIVNDTQLEGWYRSDKMSAPRLAITEFLATTDRFQLDPAMNKFYVSCARDGFLKRVK